MQVEAVIATLEAAPPEVRDVDTEAAAGAQEAPGEPEVAQVDERRGLVKARKAGD